MVEAKLLYHLRFLLFFFLYHIHPSHSQPLPNTTGDTCSANETSYPCQTYAFYRAKSPNLLDLASIGDLFSVSRLQISEPSNISSPSSPLVPGQPLFVPLSCSCNRANTTATISYANITYRIKSGDTFYIVSTEYFQNLTTYQSVELVNPTLVPTNLSVGADVIFPIFCKCPTTTQLQNQANYLISYVFQASDNLSSVATTFGVQTQSITDVNGNNIQPLDTIFIPVAQLPQLSQPEVVPSSPPSTRSEKKGVITGLGIGLGITGFLLILVIGLLVYREILIKERRKEVVGDEEKQKKQNLYGEGKLGPKDQSKGMDVNLMANVSDCLDKYRVFSIEELKESTDDFDESCLIQGSVYKGTIDGVIFAIKKMKWNAYEELKILQKVNHGNLVKLEGFCIDSEEANCYLVYEYIENGSLYSWLQENNNEKLGWKTRLRIAVDVANGLQYIHEHTRPRVVHKDIKSSNILIDSNMRAKIANFGLAKSGCNAITMHIVGTQGYISPEYLADGVVSTKMDVFAFGVVLLELISGREAIDEEGNLLWASAMNIFQGSEEEKARRLKGWMDESISGQTCSMNGVISVMSLAIACVQRDPTKRPSMVDIVYALSKSEDPGFDISDDGLGVTQMSGR